MSTEQTFADIMAGRLTAGEIRDVLVRYHERGVTPDDLMAAASAMRSAGVKVRCDDPDAVDIVGTGGDMAGTLHQHGEGRRSGRRA